MASFVAIATDTATKNGIYVNATQVFPGEIPAPSHNMKNKPRHSIAEYVDNIPNAINGRFNLNARCNGVAVAITKMPTAAIGNIV